MSTVQLRGFTLIEVLVSLTIIGVLLSILYVSFDSSRQSSRDAERKTDLTQLQLAIEVYKSQNGRYPAQGCGGSTDFTGPGPHSDAWGNNATCLEWIDGLAPDHIDELPLDPRFESNDNQGFAYQTNTDGTAYKIMSHGVAESQMISSYDEKFARCPSDCSETWCDSSGPQTNTYALYSPGAECW